MECKATFIALDNSSALAELQKYPSIKFFLTGGVRFDGIPAKGIMHSSESFSGTPLLPDSMKQREFAFGEFLNQKRIFCNGNFFTCAEIIKFTANKLGGAHTDYKREGRHADLEEAAYYLMIGGPPAEDADVPGQIYLALEPKGSEFLSGFHVEIVAAATSLIHVRLGGQPVMQLSQKRSWRTRWEEFRGKFRRRYLVHDFGGHEN
jgi:hypothetical protein